MKRTGTTGPTATPTYKPITHLPSTQTVQASNASYTAASQNNARKTPEGRAVDKKVRSALSAKTGRDASHAHSLSGGFNPGDTRNLYLGNSLQNRAGGTKAYVERQRDRAVANDPSLRIDETSVRRFKPGAQGLDKRTPISETVTHQHVKDGEVSPKRSVTFANTSSLGSRYVDQQRAAGKPVSAAEIQRLDRQQRANGKLMGTGTTKQNQASIVALRERAARGEQVNFGPRLATNNGKAVPPAASTAASGKQAAAQRLAQAGRNNASSVGKPGPQKSR